jgi:hypothetical protein
VSITYVVSLANKIHLVAAEQPIRNRPFHHWTTLCGKWLTQGHNGFGTTLYDEDVAAMCKRCKSLLPASPAPALYEAAEFAAAPTITEAADVLICLMAWLNTQGLEADDLIAVATEKMTVNHGRTWKTLADGTVQHVEETAAALSGGAS